MKCTFKRQGQGGESPIAPIQLVVNEQSHHLDDLIQQDEWPELETQKVAETK